MSTHEKACTKCGEVKPLDGFHRDKGCRDGRRAACKECVNEHKRRYREENRDEDRERKRRYYEENRDKVLESSRRYREENRDKVLERKRRYREENRDEDRERSRRYHEANRDEIAERKRRYYEENRDKKRESDRRYYEENLEYVRAKVRNEMRDYQRGSEAFLNKPKWSPWTPEEDAFLLADDGRTRYQKAIELGRTYASVAHRLRYLRQTQTV